MLWLHEKDYAMKKLHAMTAGLVMLALVAWQAAAQPTTDSLKATKDASITNENAGVPGDRSERNFGDLPYLSIDTQYNGEKSHILMEFDLSTIPADAVIQKAELVMGTPLSPEVGTIASVEVRRLLRNDWVEGGKDRVAEGVSSGASWTARYYKANGAAVAWQLPGALGAEDSAAGDAIKLPGTSATGTLEKGLDVTAHVQAARKAQQKTVGWLLRSTNDQINICRWASREAADKGGPILKVTWAK